MLSFNFISRFVVVQCNFVYFYFTETQLITVYLEIIGSKFNGNKLTGILTKTISIHPSFKCMIGHSISKLLHENCYLVNSCTLVARSIHLFSQAGTYNDDDNDVFRSKMDYK